MKLMFDTPDELLHQDWTGDCYEASMARIAPVEEDDWMVVHGTVWSNAVGKRINHAWCERGGLVIDLAMQVGLRIIEHGRYYRFGKVEVSKVLRRRQTDQLRGSTPAQ